MSTLPPGKYQLKSLHEEIDLFDRKLAHLLKYEAFPSDAERNAAAGKMTAKRELLVRKARQMADDGIEFSESELPKSLRPEKAAAAAPVPVNGSTEATGEALALVAEPEQQQPSPYAGTSLDCQPELEAYKKTKAKRKTA